MWNDTDIPLAVFFTFRCYGTWLHGDGRGSIDRNNNVYGTPINPVNDNLNKYCESIMGGEPVKLGGRRRKSVEKAVRQTCQKRGFVLFAVNIRTNHVHAVIDICGSSSTRALAALKANATRQLKEDGLWNLDRTPWVEKGSCRKLWNERGIRMAIDYVMDGQGPDLLDFDDER